MLRGILKVLRQLEREEVLMIFNSLSIVDREKLIVSVGLDPAETDIRRLCESGANIGKQA